MGLPKASLLPGLIRLESNSGRDSLTGGEPDEAQRFAGEVKFVAFHARRLADILGMKSLSLGVIEDREGQTSFRSSGTGWFGAVSQNKRSIKDVREHLAGN